MPLKWFKHFTRAHEDRGVETLISEFGIAGYGLYMYCLEIIAGNVEPTNLTFELEPDAPILARRLNIDTVLVEKIMHRCIELGLFELSERGRITCIKIVKFLDPATTSSPEIRQIISQTRGKSEKVKIYQDNLDQIRLDENRIDKRREEKSKTHTFKPPSLDEVKTYCDERANRVSPQRFVDFYESKGWMVGKNKMKDWKAAVRNWEGNDFKGGSHGPELRPDEIIIPDFSRGGRKKSTYQP